MEDFKEVIANNLIRFRKQAKLTQAELAEKLNYSDKAVSKWERAESLPDILVLKQIADLYGITIDVLTREEESVKVSDKWQPEKKGKLSVMQKILITLISCSIVWFVATAVFVVTNILTSLWTKSWMCFIYAIPVSMIVFLVFSCMWWNEIVQDIAISLLVWSLLLTVDLAIYRYNTWLLFIIGVPVQIFMVFLTWYRILKKRQKRGAKPVKSAS